MLACSAHHDGRDGVMRTEFALAELDVQCLVLLGADDLATQVRSATRRELWGNPVLLGEERPQWFRNRCR